MTLGNLIGGFITILLGENKIREIEENKIMWKRLEYIIILILIIGMVLSLINLTKYYGIFIVGIGLGMFITIIITDILLNKLKYWNKIMEINKNG